ncbi:MAG TPA: alpha/beta fold hydrolase [Actinomycetota bacterium]|jgi:haloalkane dehalogenase|nr:alpha/beta fold hydrolase [Actinomycetota bacterium]
MATRPAWVDQELFPFQSHFAEVDGARVHYIDEGQGPVFLGLHGNPTWSFLYRHIVHGLKDRFRCVALDYPGFGLSTAPAGYGYTVAEHARVVEGFVSQLGLEGVTLMVQDWSGPIGLSVAVRHPERFRAFVIGNTFGWPVRGEKTFERFSKLLGSRGVRKCVHAAYGRSRSRLATAPWRMSCASHCPLVETPDRCLAGGWAAAGAV